MTAIAARLQSGHASPPSAKTTTMVITAFCMPNSGRAIEKVVSSRKVGDGSHLDNQANHSIPQTWLYHLVLGDILGAITYIFSASFGFEQWKHIFLSFPTPPVPIRLDLELLVLTHHSQEPVEGLTGGVEAVWVERSNVTSVEAMPVSGIFVADAQAGFA